MDPWDIDLVVVMDTVLGATELRSLARDVDRGIRRRLRPGVYVDRARFDALSPIGQHKVQMLAYAATCVDPPVFSHWSAAVMHGLPFLGDHLSRVHTTTAERSGRRREGLSAHLLALPDHDVVGISGVRCTTPARTAVDIACAAPFDDGLVIMDAVLHAGLIGAKDALRAALASAETRKGSVRANAVIEFADGASESAGESIGRHSMFRLGLEAPVLQWKVFTVDGVFVARLDFHFPSVNVGAEFDGRVKFFDPETTKGNVSEVLWQEKRREDEARQYLAGFARFGWREAGDPRLLGPILGRAGVRPRQFVLL